VPRVNSGFPRCIPPDVEVSRGVCSRPGGLAGGDPRGAILWGASRELEREGEVVRGGVSFCAVRLTALEAMRVWEGGLGYYGLLEISSGVG